MSIRVVCACEFVRKFIWPVFNMTVVDGVMIFPPLDEPWTVQVVDSASLTVSQLRIGGSKGQLIHFLLFPSAASFPFPACSSGTSFVGQNLAFSNGVSFFCLDSMTLRNSA